jgi:hypothetical protein
MCRYHVLYGSFKPLSVNVVIMAILFLFVKHGLKPLDELSN